MAAGEQSGPTSEQSQAQWRLIRQALKDKRHELSLLAPELYPDVPRVEGTGLLRRPEWLPAGPVGLEQAELVWDVQADEPVIAGSGPESVAVRPLRADGTRFASYAEAVEALDRPALFENRFLYRPAGADFSSPGAGRLNLASGHYFDSISVSEALAHEFAAAVHDRDGVPRLDELPLRAAVGDPCELRRRPVSMAVSTLTLRREGPGRASFLLHWRDPAKVTHAGGMYQVLPVGIFQPADENPASVRPDLNLWHSMVREFSEELLGKPEDYGRFGSPVAYEQWPFFRQLSRARQEGRVRVSVVGLGVDPLSLVCDLLTVAVFDAETFDRLFGGLVSENAEGHVVNDGGATRSDFSAQTVDRLAGSDAPMQAAGAAVLRLAWKHARSLI